MTPKAKPKAKAKSAVSGRYVKASDAKANPRETYRESDSHEKCVRLTLWFKGGGFVELGKVTEFTLTDVEVGE